MSRQLTSDPESAGQALYTSQATQVHALGERMSTSDGRVFRYAKAGASDLVAGNMIQAPAQIANHLALTPVAAAIGATSISVALGATAATAGQYAGGWAIISTTPGNGYAYPISGHAAIASSGTGVFQLEEPLKVALTTSSRVDLQMNPYNGVIQTPITTLTGAVVGNAPYIITAAEYGWIQTRGPAACLVKGTPGVGLAVVCPGTVAGCVVVDGAASETPVVGTMMTTGVDAKNNAVFLLLE
jgi:hypothetical protein